jgi:hypothetical protein
MLSCHEFQARRNNVEHERFHQSIPVSDMSVFAQRHSLGTLKRNAFAELADTRGGFKGLRLPLFNGGELRAAKCLQEHILDAGEVSGLELLLEYELQFGVVDLDGHGRLLASLSA